MDNVYASNENDPCFYNDNSFNRVYYWKEPRMAKNDDSKNDLQLIPEKAY